MNMVGCSLRFCLQSVIVAACLAILFSRAVATPPSEGASTPPSSSPPSSLPSAYSSRLLWFRYEGSRRSSLSAQPLRFHSVLSLHVPSDADTRLVEREILLTIGVDNGPDITNMRPNDVIISRVYDPVSRIVFPFSLLPTLPPNEEMTAYDIRLARRKHVLSHREPLQAREDELRAATVPWSRVLRCERCIRRQHGLEELQRIDSQLSLEEIMQNTWPRDGAASPSSCEVLCGSFTSPNYVPNTLLAALQPLAFLKMEADIPQLAVQWRKQHQSNIQCLSKYIDSCIGTTDDVFRMNATMSPSGKLTVHHLSCQLADEQLKFIGRDGNLERSFVQLRLRSDSQTNRTSPILPVCNCKFSSAASSAASPYSTAADCFDSFHDNVLLYADLSRALLRVLLAAPALGLDVSVIDRWLDPSRRHFFEGISTEHNTGSTKKRQRDSEEQLAHPDIPRCTDFDPFDDRYSLLNVSCISPSTSFGSNVARYYRYIRPSNRGPSSPFDSGTSIHADMGLITLSPLSTSPALATLHPSGTFWVDAEKDDDGGATSGCHDEEKSTCRELPFFQLAFIGQILGQLSPLTNSLPPVLHYVHHRKEALDQARFSFPFFLRAHPDSILCDAVLHPQARKECEQLLSGTSTVASYMNRIVTPRRKAIQLGWHAFPIIANQMNKGITIETDY